ncbi:MAG: hypothetical protein A2504_09205 [Bdellovibrionales bacterium RIFOXYD12_FULL_39_22]|nr:MAG: hypothetical protein A2385_17345 [Bdellovibrionales bacterium RIFOXYB1_FULL_39_21]OFZ41081.1 MAG: hypothetical protein A2485_00270 [Bdellovibrionales bacterium RIFOXYC12_FULL_39_17]OFZ50294.1 MAG: hypothetical protein A2404_07585 [Bdellovibrionales bacterium RIFOXYC1_FULL_39_130]OFZ71818.1 MAG: hypothetical protein A2451_09630 [Bdellovibrionales bacterium RIFOXYC2_FULL_39_8]OFZ75095.1 MAG: hypothetical protein A2560_16280 [Bdellovibrionales bacterium RIFOXYD1_FULL_39_84]OFZ92263.1 MAG:
MIVVIEIFFATLILITTGLGLDLLQKASCQSSILQNSFSLITKQSTTDLKPLSSLSRSSFICDSPLIISGNKPNLVARYQTNVAFKMHLEGNL